MWVGIVSCMPDLINGALADGVVGRAIANGIFELEIFNPREHAVNDYGSIDDRPFGGAPGMLMMAEPIAQSVEAARSASSSSSIKTIYLSPQGERLNQSRVRELSKSEALILIAGRYEGLDERIIEEYVDLEISIGDYVLSGGELPAMVLLDAIARQVGGTLGNEKSSADDSFGDNLLEGPQYTRPRTWRGREVPEVLASGNHEKIKRWRHEQALLRTWQRRPDLMVHREFTKEDREWLQAHTTRGHYSLGEH